MDKRKAREVRIQISDLLDDNCVGCKAKQQIYKESGLYASEMHCHKNCEVGHQLRELSAKLASKPKKPPRPERREATCSQSVLTREAYLEMKGNDESDWQIANKFDYSEGRLRKMKKRWGLSGKVRVV